MEACSAVAVATQKSEGLNAFEATANGGQYSVSKLSSFHVFQQDKFLHESYMDSQRVLSRAELQVPHSGNYSLTFFFFL